MKNQILAFSEDPRQNAKDILRKAGEFAWRHKGKIIAGSVVLVTGGMAAPAIAAAMGGAGLLGAAGTGTLISTLHGCALTSASLASVGGTVAGGTAVITGAGTAVATATGAAIDKLTNKKK